MRSVFEGVYNWRASEASKTLSGVTNGNRRYICIYIYRRVKRTNQIAP